MKQLRHASVTRLLLVALLALAAAPAAHARQQTAPIITENSHGQSRLTTSSQPSNRILHNDIAHYGTQGQRTTSATSELQLEPPTRSLRADGGFSWVTAALAAAGGLGLLLAAAAATAALRRRRADPAQASLTSGP